MEQKNPVLEALQLYGTEAIPGGANNPQVLEFYAEAGHPEVKTDEVPWCAAFMGAIMRRCGLPITGSLLARSWLHVGVPPMKPEVGDIVIFWRISPESGLGHVGFFISRIGNTIYVLGGNEDNRVQIKGFDAAQLLGYRRMTVQQ